MLSEGRKTSLNEKGISLLEVLMTLLILSLLVGGILTIITTAALWAAKARDESVAAGYAFAILENLRADRDKLNGAIDPGELVAEKPACMEAKIAMESGADGFANLYKVVVTVNKTDDAPGNPPLLRMGTLIRKE